MATATCNTNGCPLNGVAYEIDVPMAPGERVMCGACARATVIDGTPPEPPPPFASPWTIPTPTPPDDPESENP